MVLDILLKQAGLYSVIFKMRDANALELLTFQTFLNLHLKLTGKMHLQQKQKKKFGKLLEMKHLRRKK